MLTSEINKRLKKYESFLGTFPCDLIPASNNRPIGIIINTDKSTGKGEHWVAIFINNMNIAEYFDSFGLPPITPDIVKYLQNNSSKYFFNPFQIQGINATTCGEYCIVFIEQKINGLDFTDIMSLFTKRQNVNDSIVKYYAD